MSNGINNASGIAGSGGSSNAGDPGGSISSVNYNIQSNREIRE